MKRIIETSVLLIVLVSLSVAQFKAGSLELSLTASLGSFTGEVSGVYKDSDSRKFATLAVSPGYYIADGFSIEPEVSWFAMESLRPTWFFLGNLAYTYCIPNLHLAPFVRAGYGASNGVAFPFGGSIPARVSNKLDVGVLNLGGGLKILVTEGALIRIEMNYRRSNRTEELRSFGTSMTTDYTYSNVALVVGVSIIL